MPQQFTVMMRISARILFDWKKVAARFFRTVASLPAAKSAVFAACFHA
jgi:hypothetical protein